MSLFADILDVPLQGEFIELVEWQAGKQFDTPRQHEEGIDKCAALFVLTARHRRRIGNSPMGCHRLTRPERTLLTGSLVGQDALLTALKASLAGEGLAIRT